MLELLITLTPIGLIDSLSLLPFAVVVLAVLLGGPRPYLTSIGFLAGTMLSYFAAGVLIVFGLGALLQQATRIVVEWWNNPRTIDYVLGMVVGAALIVLGYRWAVARRATAERRQVAAGLAPGQAFVMGAGATIAGLWGALPYFAAIDAILKADVSYVEGTLALAYYCAVFIAFAGLLVVIRAVVGARANVVVGLGNRAIEVGGRRGLSTLRIVLGAVMLADGVGWLLGRPLIPVGAPAGPPQGVSTPASIPMAGLPIPV